MKSIYLSTKRVALTMISLFAMTTSLMATDYNFSVAQASAKAVGTSANEYRGVGLSGDYLVGVDQVASGTACTFTFINITTGEITNVAGGTWGGSDFAIASFDNDIVSYAKNYHAASNSPWRWIYHLNCTEGTAASAGAQWTPTNAGSYNTSSRELRTGAARANGSFDNGSVSYWGCPESKDFVLEFTGTGASNSTYTLSGVPSGYTHGAYATASKYDTDKMLLCSVNGLYDCSISGSTISATDITPSGVDATNLLGSVMFTLCDHTFLVRSTSGTCGASDFGVFDVTDGFPGTAVISEAPFSGTGATADTNMWINIKKDSETQATIIVFVRDLGVAKYVMTAEEVTVPDVYILGTVNGNTWAPNVGVQMTYDANSSSYTATVSAGANGASFNMATALGADSNWDNFNGHNYRWGVQGGSNHNVTSAEYGTDLGAQMWDYNPGSWVVPEGEYNITWKFTGEYEATINIEKIEPVPDVYILGQVDGNAWAPNVGVQMTYDETTGLHSADVFVCKTSDTDNYGYFSFTTALGESWDAIAASRFGAVSEGDFLVDGHLGEEISLTASNGQSFKCLAGYYTITVDYKRMKAVINTKSFAPMFNPEPGTYYKVVNIAIASEEVPDADIYVTFHGETPTPESFHLTKELTLDATYTVKAIAVKYGVVSEVATGEFIITNEVPIDPDQFEFVKVMETTQNIIAAANGRFSTGYGDGVYITDKSAGTVYKYDASGNRSVFKDGLPSGIGTAITSDDAGNILIQNGWAAASGSTNWIIIEPNGDTHDLALTFPEGVTAARNDAAGRIVGNVMSSDGGYFCLMPNGNTLAAVFHIVNGAQDGDASVVTPAGNITADSSTIAQPTASDISLFAADPTAYWALRVRSNKHITRDVTRNASDGFDIFQLGGNTYTVEPIGTNYKDGYAIFKDGESEPVAVREETVSSTSYLQQSLTARVSEDGSYATIYQNFAGALVSMYTYGMPPTGVEKVGNDNSEATEVSAVYYNLQGQRVTNPAKGQVAIRVATLSDGSLRTKKVVIR